MALTPGKNLNLRWHQPGAYLICLASIRGDMPGELMQALQAAGMTKHDASRASLAAPQHWKASWDALYAIVVDSRALDLVQAAVVPLSEGWPEQGYKTAADMQNVAAHLWFGAALLEGRVMCYLQPVLDGRGQVFGYESFARARSSDGSVLGGGQVMEASRALSIEYAVDRQLHVQAITTFISSAFNGFLFVNLFPDFILRPEVYLEGLSETALKQGLVSRHIVLDVMESETRDPVQLHKICDYARARGMSVALDDIQSLAAVRKFVPELSPDFVKLDSKLVARADQRASRDTIRLICELVHSHGGSVIAEGVETQSIYQQLEPLGVDLFQGYFLSPPLPVEAVLKRVVN